MSVMGCAADWRPERRSLFSLVSSQSMRRFAGGVILLKQSNHRNSECIRQFQQRTQPDVFLAAFNCARKGSRKAALMRQLFLRPLPLASELLNPLA